MADVRRAVSTYGRARLSAQQGPVRARSVWPPDPRRAVANQPTEGSCCRCRRYSGDDRLYGERHRRRKGLTVRWRSCVGLSSGAVTLWLRGADDLGCVGSQLPCLRDGLGNDLATSEQCERREQQHLRRKRRLCSLRCCVSAWFMWPRSIRALRATASLDSSSTSSRHGGRTPAPIS